MDGVLVQYTMQGLPDTSAPLELSAARELANRGAVLKQYILAGQYGRKVATVWVRPPPPAVRSI